MAAGEVPAVVLATVHETALNEAPDQRMELRLLSGHMCADEGDHLGVLEGDVWTPSVIRHRNVLPILGDAALPTWCNTYFATAHASSPTGIVITIAIPAAHSTCFNTDILAAGRGVATGKFHAVPVGTIDA